MVEVTQADREAAKRYFREADTSDVFHGTELAEAFARQRLAERDAVVKWLRGCRSNKLAHHRSVCHYEDDEILDAIITAADTFGYSADAIEAGEPFR